MIFKELSRILLVASLIALVFSGITSSSASAGDLQCAELGGEVWFEPGPIYFCAVTCPDGSVVVGSFVGYPSTPEDYGVPSCPKSSVAVPSPIQLGKCKLLSIDDTLHIGTSFAASWLGRLDSIRFRQAGTTIVFVSPISGSFHFENGHRAGDFLALGLDRGRWEATCWGAGGTFGTAFVVFVK